MAKKKAQPNSRSAMTGHTPTLCSETTGITSGWYSPPTHRDVSDTILDDVASWKRADDLGETPSRHETREIFDEAHTYIESLRETEAELDEVKEQLEKANDEDNDRRKLSDANRKTINEALAFALRAALTEVLRMAHPATAGSYTDDHKRAECERLTKALAL